MDIFDILVFFLFEHQIVYYKAGRYEHFVIQGYLFKGTEKISLNVVLEMNV